MANRLFDLKLFSEWFVSWFYVVINSYHLIRNLQYFKEFNKLQHCFTESLDLPITVDQYLQMSHEQQEKLFPSVELLPGNVFYHDKLCILDIETFIRH